MFSYLKLIKFDSLILIAFAQVCIKYGLFAPFDVAVTLNGFQFSLLVIASLCIVAGNNIMEEILQRENNSPSTLLYPTISKKTLNRLFIIFNVLGVIIGFYISYVIGKSKLASLFVITSGIFYIYQTYLKEIMVVKNIIIAILSSLCLFIIGIFDLLPAIETNNQASQKVFFLIIVDYASFAFFIVFIREILKDCISVDKDYNNNLRTIPIALGKDRTAKLISMLTLIPLGMIIHYIYTYLYSNTTAVVIVLGALIAPLLYFMIRSWLAISDSHFKALSVLLKLILTFAAASLLLYQFILE